VEIKWPNMLGVTNNGRQNMRASHIGPQVGILTAMKVMEPRNGKSLEMGNWNNKIVFEYPSDPSDFDP
jgi:hypothetical protein